MKQTATPYDLFLKTPAREHWKKVGTERRAGVCLPLFSIYSKQSIGIGEIPDLRYVIDWCSKTGLSILELLPLNDVGFDFFPYDAQSVFALDPMYLSLEKLRDVKVSPWKSQFEKIRQKYPCQNALVDYEVKRTKLILLRSMFETSPSEVSKDYLAFKTSNQPWLEDYALFKCLQESHFSQTWEFWPEIFRRRDQNALKTFAASKEREIYFQCWLQWQLYEQMKDIKAYAESRKILLMGDMPFLVSRNSDYVWAHQNDFRLDFAAGAPPDLDHVKGQRWGMPPYRAARGASEHQLYWKRRLECAENFYHLCRIDHIIGMFRVWMIATTQPMQDQGSFGSFDPENPGDWEKQGDQFLRLLLKNASMLPCGEDLGTVPDCAPEKMRELGIPGMDIQRWKRNWQGDYSFTNPEQYRFDAVTMLSTHDTSSFKSWWKWEAGTVNARVFERWCQVYQVSFEGVINQLFEKKESSFDRLRWSPSVKSLAHFLSIIQKKESQAPKLAFLYQSTFDEKKKFKAFLGASATENSVFKLALEKNLAASSIYSIQMVQDWLSLDPSFRLTDEAWFRFNIPGTVGGKNWKVRLPFPVEKMQSLKVNRPIQMQVKQSNRL